MSLYYRRKLDVHLVCGCRSNLTSASYLGIEIIKHQATLLGIPMTEVALPAVNRCFDFLRVKEFVVAHGTKRLIHGFLSESRQPEPFREFSDYCEAKEIHVDGPLMGKIPVDNFKTFLKLGFKAIVVGSRVGPEILGTEVTEDSTPKLLETGLVATFVTDGPLFSRPIKISKTSVDDRGKFQLLRIESFS